MSDVKVESNFPRAKGEGYRMTSPATPQYNCIAWAADDNTLLWWPDSQHYWPDDIPRENLLKNFILLYQKFGYSLCNNAALEEGFLKVAVYVGANGLPTHAARQLSSGKWTSKLGLYNDIEHNTLQALFSDVYGTVGVVMKRPVHS